MSQPWRESVLDGALPVPAGSVAEPFIDADDSADIVVPALTSDKHVGRLYEVTGPRLLTFADAAAEISRASGREVSYIPLSSEEFATSLAQEGLPMDFVTELTALFSDLSTVAENT